ncbi:hypothetical protein [Nocardia jiangxiensis]|uniref:hypothetical protein n=1 Tax=Nocardia jiangxiensis TaxID=282685 RepID=UPI0002E3F352|nr:hypothetical protein [Nocardia jiangxiensis]
MAAAMSDEADFVVITPDGTVLYDMRDQYAGLRAAIAQHVPDLSTQGMGRVRAWFADNFNDPALAANPLADQVFAGLGYHHPTGWYGPVALTMEENTSGHVPPLTLEVRERLDDLLAGVEVTSTDAADPQAPNTTAEMIDAALPDGSDIAADIDTATTQSAPPSAQNPDSGVDL